MEHLERYCAVVSVAKRDGISAAGDATMPASLGTEATSSDNY